MKPLLAHKDTRGSLRYGICPKCDRTVWLSDGDVCKCGERLDWDLVDWENDQDHYDKICNEQKDLIKFTREHWREIYGC